MDAQAAKDFDRFSQPDPAEVEKEKKARAQYEKSRKAQAKAVKPEQLQAAAKLTEHMQEEKDAAERARLMELIVEYRAILAKYYPEKDKIVQVPKTIAASAGLPELRTYVKMFEREFGKKSGMTMAKGLLVQAAGQFELLNKNKRFGANLDNLKMAVEFSLQPKLDPETEELRPSNLEALLAELTAKHGNWFNSRVEIRFMMEILGICVMVHRSNEQTQDALKKANEPVAEATADLIGKL